MQLDYPSLPGQVAKRERYQNIHRAKYDEKQKQNYIYQRSFLEFNPFYSFQLLNLAVGGAVKTQLDQVLLKYIRYIDQIF